MSDDTYNGWENKFTWLVCLWIDNDEGALESVLDLVKDMDTGSALAAGEAVQSWLEEMREAGDDLTSAPSLETDMLTTAFGFVNWREVGEHYLGKAADIAANS